MPDAANVKSRTLGEGYGITLVVGPDKDESVMATRNRTGDILGCGAADHLRADSPRPAEIDQNLRGGPTVHRALATLMLTQPRGDAFHVEAERRSQAAFPAKLKAVGIPGADLVTGRR